MMEIAATPAIMSGDVAGLDRGGLIHTLHEV